MRTLLPFDARDPKSRLSPVLDADERESFAAAMLADVLDALEPTELTPTVVTTEPLAYDLTVPVRVDDRPLDPLVDEAIAEGTPVAVVMADLPLIGPAQVQSLQETPGDVVFAPGRGGGTNAMVVRDDSFSVDYHGISISDHRAIAQDLGLTVGMVDSFRFATDVDEPEDLLEVLIHGSGRSAAWLREAGFEIDIEDGRPVVTRR